MVCFVLGPWTYLADVVENLIRESQLGEILAKNEKVCEYSSHPSLMKGKTKNPWQNPIGIYSMCSLHNLPWLIDKALGCVLVVQFSPGPCMQPRHSLVLMKLATASYANHTQIAI